jgi:hypothetical protein
MKKNTVEYETCKLGEKAIKNLNFGNLFNFLRLQNSSKTKNYAKLNKLMIGQNKSIFLSLYKLYPNFDHPMLLYTFLRCHWLPIFSNSYDKKNVYKKNR